MGIRSMFNQIFGAKQQVNNDKNYVTLTALNNFNPVFTNFGNDIYCNDIARSCIHAIATHTAKTKAVHTLKTGNSRIEKLLQIRPNIYMSAYDMFYKTVTQLYINNNAYIFIMRDEFGMITGFYPVQASSVKFLEYQNEIYCKFDFIGGQKVTLPYEDLIHLRRHYNSNDLYGDSNIAIYSTLELLNTVEQGIENTIQGSQNLRGLLKFEGVIKHEDMKREKDNFVADYMNLTNTGGIAALDKRMEYIELKTDYKMVDDKQLTAIEDSVYNYFNVNRNIVNGNYTEDQFNAFYESVIEPITIQMSLEFTSKLFTDREIKVGNSITFESNRINFASNSTKVNMVKELIPLGLMTVNEARELFSMSAVPGGDKRQISLNYVNADKQDKYQLGEKETTEPEIKRGDLEDVQRNT